MATLVVDAYEGQDVAIFYAPGDYLNSDMPEEKDARLKLQIEFMDIMCEVNPDNIPNIWYKNLNKVLYFRIMKVLYGCIELDILWYDLYGNTLKELGFVINPYDQCIENKKWMKRNVRFAGILTPTRCTTSTQESIK